MEFEELELGQSINLVDGEHEDWDGNSIIVREGYIVEIRIWGQNPQIL